MKKEKSDLMLKTAKDCGLLAELKYGILIISDPEFKYFYDLSSFEITKVSKEDEGFNSDSGNEYLSRHFISWQDCYRSMIEHAAKKGAEVEFLYEDKKWYKIDKPSLTGWNIDLDHPERVYRLSAKK